MQIDLRDLQGVPFRQPAVRQAVAHTAATVGLTCDRISLVFVDDLRIQDVNRRFRDVDAPTDVITFDLEPDEDGLVGEIILSAETALRQAAAAGHSLDHELAWLASHGVLHLAGMDDETEEDLEEMLVIQRRVLAELPQAP